jgi:hypothetical protein
MTPSSLQGLNVVHPPPSPTNQDSDSLLNASSYPDLSAQLDLWTNLAFDSDEPHEKYQNDKGSEGSCGGGEDIDDDDGPEGPALHDRHDNVVTGKTATIGDDNRAATGAAMAGSMSLPPQTTFDLTSFLSGFGIDGLLVPQIPNSQQAGIVPSLAQLLAAHSPITAAFQQQSQQPHSPQPPSAYSNQPSHDSLFPPPSKRARTRKSSISTIDSAADFLDRDGTPSPNTTTPLSPAEDKRRRNTAASARFRLKKKEREAALEKKSKELEGRVNELERECEGLRRENGWLKGLVVGVTGAAPNQATTAPTTAGTKRNREGVNQA